MKSNFKLSANSLKKLEGVDQRLVDVVKLAIQYTTVDFGVICGLRTIKEQMKLFEAGATQTMTSKHIDGKAVDLMAYVNRRACWEISVYDNIADAMAQAANELNVSIKWGAAWTINNIAKFDGTMEEAYELYIRERLSQNRRPFIDGPHFELS